MINKKTALVLIVLVTLVTPSLSYIQNCLKSNYATGREVCEVCMVGYYVSNYGYTCSSCSYSCATCNGPLSNQCTSCSQGKYLTSSFTCYPCTFGCQTCTDGETCITCSLGYFKTFDLKCGRCISNCNSCINSSECQSCSLGYFKTFDFKCGKCISNCNSCINGSQCQSCTSPYEKVVINSMQDECRFTTGSAVKVFVIIGILILLIPYIICCFCWAAVASCLGWSNETVVVEDGYTSYSQPPAPFSPPPPAYQPSYQPAYQPAFPAPPPGHYNNGYQNNSGMPF